MGYSSTKTSIDELIDDIVGSDNNRNAFKECPVCHHIIPADSEFCKYCFEIFEDFDDEKDLIKITNVFLSKINELSKIAASRDIYIPNLIDNIKNANKNLKNGKIKKAHKIIQNNYLELSGRLSRSILEESKRYKILLSLNPTTKNLFKKLETLTSEWKFDDALKELEKIKIEYMEFSKQLQIFLEDLERAERGSEIAEGFGIDPSPTLEIIDRAKDEADKRNYGEAVRILKEAFFPLKKDIGEVMNDILNDIKNKKDHVIKGDETYEKRLFLLLSELNFYWKSDNLVSVLERLDELKKEF